MGWGAEPWYQGGEESGAVWEGSSLYIPWDHSSLEEAGLHLRVGPEQPCYEVWILERF